MKLSTNVLSLKKEIKILKEIRNYRKQNSVNVTSVPRMLCNGMFELTSKTFENTEVCFFVMKKYDSNLEEFLIEFIDVKN